MNLNPPPSRSANSSGHKSKRSSDSNNSSTNSKKKTKTTTNQKTLGVSWGASSLSSSRSSFQRSSPFADFGSYMVEKNRKLQIQFDTEALSSSGSEKSIFQGVSIFVDGFTVPSSQELRAYMANYGGRYENYFSRRRVTHIICSNLPDSKIKNLRSFSRGLPVVKPNWIVESVVANKLLSWVPYQLEQVACNQPRLSAFFTPKTVLDSDDALRNTFNQVKNESEDRSSIGAILDDTNKSEVCRSKEQKQESDDLINDNTNGLFGEESYVGEKSSEVKLQEVPDSDSEDNVSVKHELKFSTHRHSASVTSSCLPSSENMGSNQSHSTLGDPNFVENYFKSSRLHFIGTWRNRYRKRFPSSSKGLNDKESKRCAPDSSSKTPIIHIDMDCFFVSVVIRQRPELKDRPVAVCHSDSPKGTAEISSANYPARNYGVRAGMFVRDAKAHCPHLVILPYDFEAYEEVADQFYDILHKHCRTVQAVSCDEAFLDVTYLEGVDPDMLASTVRQEIFETTGCTASAGIARNMLMARLATRSAKPDGQCNIPPETVDDYLCQLPTKMLPGIGHVLEEKLKKRNVSTCGQLRMIPKDSLQKDFGIKPGEMLWNHSRGIDNRLVGVIQETKSIGAEVNWGVRFNDLKDSQDFLLNLCKEVSLRLQGCAVQGRTFTLKIKKRRKDAQEPVKYMGCGDCENLSHSLTVPVATDDVEVLQRITKQLFGLFSIDVKEIRGIGLQVSKLDSTDASKQGLRKNSLKSWLQSAKANTENSIDDEAKATADVEGPRTDRSSDQLCNGSVGIRAPMDNQLSSGEPSNQVSAPPPLCHLDIEVVESLPPELFKELNRSYGGKLVDFVARNKRGFGATTSHERVNGARSGSGRHLCNVVGLRNETVLEPKHTTVEKQAMTSLVVRGSSDVAILTSAHENTDIMPASLSQVDPSVLLQLPEELKADLLQQLPEHRRYEFASSAACSDSLAEVPGDSLDMSDENQSDSRDQDFNNKLWFGHPPLWVKEFKASKCMILSILAEMYDKSGSTGDLSLALRRTIMGCQHSLDSSADCWIEAVNSLSELLRQYVALKINLDIEEIYVCFRLLRRLTTKSKFFLQVYIDVLPYLQLWRKLAHLDLCFLSSDLSVGAYSIHQKSMLQFVQKTDPTIQTSIHSFFHRCRDTIWSRDVLPTIISDGFEVSNGESYSAIASKKPCVCNYFYNNARRCTIGFRFR